MFPQFTISPAGDFSTNSSSSNVSRTFLWLLPPAITYFKSPLKGWDALGTAFNSVENVTTLKTFLQISSTGATLTASWMGHPNWKKLFFFLLLLHELLHLFGSSTVLSVHREQSSWVNNTFWFRNISPWCSWISSGPDFHCEPQTLGPRSLRCPLYVAASPRNPTAKSANDQSHTRFTYKAEAEYCTFIHWSSEEIRRWSRFISGWHKQLNSLNSSD